jgi:hypothetical protein
VSQTPEQELGALLRFLRPAPWAWVSAAIEIPRLERELEYPPGQRGNAPADPSGDAEGTTEEVRDG